MQSCKCFGVMKQQVTNLSLSISYKTLSWDGYSQRPGHQTSRGISSGHENVHPSITYEDWDLEFLTGINDENMSFRCFLSPIFIHIFECVIKVLHGVSFIHRRRLLMINWVTKPRPLPFCEADAHRCNESQIAEIDSNLCIPGCIKLKVHQR